jgi:hypothetical protein
MPGSARRRFHGAIVSSRMKQFPDWQALFGQWDARKQ